MKGERLQQPKAAATSFPLEFVSQDRSQSTLQLSAEPLREMFAKCLDASPLQMAQVKQPEEIFGGSVQRRLSTMIDHSPRLAAQAKRREVIFGKPVQQQKATAANHLPPEAEEDQPYQLKAAPAGAAAQRTSAPNHTGLPDQLKAGIEALSGISMDHVRVHSNSAKPAQLQAHAFAQGSDIHLAPGQEKHLPHEAWHVVQQAQGRVRPTMQMKGGVPVNDDAGLEREADVMGEMALQTTKMGDTSMPVNTQLSSTVLQGRFSQTALNLQTEHFGGVRCQYSAAENEIEFHIDAGANAGGNLMQDFLIALWAARDAITAGQARHAGHVIMHPGGVQVVKMTMEMLGEALGQGPNLAAAREAKLGRKREALNPSQGVPEGMQDDVLGEPVAAEHLAYRDSLVGVGGVSMAPVGGGTMLGDTDMLEEANDEMRASYDLAVGQVRHALSLNVRLNLAALGTVITSIESGLKWYQIAALKVKAWKQ